MKGGESMTKEQLMEQVASSTGATKKSVEEIVNAILENITKALMKGDKVALTGFGTFQVSNRAARQGVNPKTGEKIKIPAMTVPKFKAGKGLKEAVK